MFQMESVAQTMCSRSTSLEHWWAGIRPFLLDTQSSSYCPKITNIVHCHYWNHSIWLLEGFYVKIISTAPVDAQLSTHRVWLNFAHITRNTHPIITNLYQHIHRAHQSIYKQFTAGEVTRTTRSRLFRVSGFITIFGYFSFSENAHIYQWM